MDRLRIDKTSRPFPIWIKNHLWLLFIASLVFLPYIYWLGFYHDDWQFVFARSAGQDVKVFFTVDRPFIGISPCKKCADFWLQRVNVAIGRCFAPTVQSISFILFISILISQRSSTRVRIIAAAIFLLYPGYLIFPSAVTHLPHMLALDFALLSFLLLIIKSLKIPAPQTNSTHSRNLLHGNRRYSHLCLHGGTRIFYWLPGGADGAAFPAIEKNPEDITRRKKVGLFLSRVFFPLMASAIFLYWRFRIFVPKRAAVDNDLVFKPLMENPLQQAWIYLITLVRSSFEILVMAYIAPLLRQFSGLEARQIVINILVTCLLVGLMIWIGLQTKDRLDPRWQVKWIITGLLLYRYPAYPGRFGGARGASDG